MQGITTNRRKFLFGSGAAALGLKYGVLSDALADSAGGYRRWEDIMRNKWTWDSVVRGSRGVNCTGHCAFNIYVKNGIVWREEQQGEYGRSGDDTPDYGPRGCQKGLRQHKHMYGKQRVLYPMKRTGERGEGQWERISWDDALNEICNKFVDYAMEDGPESITMAMGTAMILKRTAFTGLFRFANLTGLVIPETFAGVGDLPLGAQMTLGHPLPGDNMAAVYKSKVCLVWACNPAATRIPDAHFFWEAKYNGTEVIVISPDFNASAIHASKWLNIQPGTDSALAMAMVNVIFESGAIDKAYIQEQTDLPFLVRKDNKKFLRAEDMGEGEHGFYFWDEVSNAVAMAPATDGEFNEFYDPQFTPTEASIALGELQPAIEGSWTVETQDGPVEVTTVYELARKHAANFTPEAVADEVGLNAQVIRDVALKFANSPPGMIFSGYRANKWLHGDLVNRAWLLMCALTGNTGRVGGGMQTTNLPKADGMFKLVFDGVGPRIRIASLAVWDYAHGDGKELNTQNYGAEVARGIDEQYQKALANYWVPKHDAKPWRMAIMPGHNPVNWRASGHRFNETVLSKVETMIAMTPDMSVTAMYSDYVLPVAHMYERNDLTAEGRVPYMQALTQAVPPLGESLDDWTIMKMMSKRISEIVVERGITAVPDNYYGTPMPRDYSKLYEQYTLGGTLTEDKDVVQYLLQNSYGMPNDMTWEEFSNRGFIRPKDSTEIQFGPESPFDYRTLASTRDKKPYKTLTGRQQYYLDQATFLAEGEVLPTAKAPLSSKGYEMRLTMGHARHGIHSLWRDDSLLVSLQRGEPDVYINPDDAKARGVEDGEHIRIFNDFGSFVALSHVSSSMQPGQLFMYHGWDPMMFRDRQNFNAVIPTAGLLKPVQMVGEYGQLSYMAPDVVPNQTHHDYTCDFEKTDAKPLHAEAS